jgi:hypothetical protein
MIEKYCNCGSVFFKSFLSFLKVGKSGYCVKVNQSSGHQTKENGQTKLVVRIYRMNTKELYTFKMIQKTNVAYLELHTYTSR